MVGGWAACSPEERWTRCYSDATATRCLVARDCCDPHSTFGRCCNYSTRAAYHHTRPPCLLPAAVIASAWPRAQSGSAPSLSRASSAPPIACSCSARSWRSMARCPSAPVKARGIESAETHAWCDCVWGREIVARCGSTDDQHGCADDEIKVCGHRTKR